MNERSIQVRCSSHGNVHKWIGVDAVRLERPPAYFDAGSNVGDLAQINGHLAKYLAECAEIILYGVRGQSTGLSALLLADLPSSTPRTVLLNKVAQRSAGCDDLGQFRLRRHVHDQIAKIYDVTAINVTNREIVEERDEPPDRALPP